MLRGVLALRGGRAFAEQGDAGQGGHRRRVAALRPTQWPSRDCWAASQSSPRAHGPIDLRLTHFGGAGRGGNRGGNRQDGTQPRDNPSFSHGKAPSTGIWAAIYQNQTRGEALVRNVVYGERYARDVFGVSPEVAHLADIPGFTRQYPQILTKAAIPYMVMTRMGPRDLSLFNWRAPDGSAVLVWNTINGYGWGVLRRHVGLFPLQERQLP